MMTAKPDYYAEDIADLLKCTPEYIRATARRNGWKFKPRLHIAHIRIPVEWIDRNRQSSETTRETLDRLSNLERK